MVEAGFCGDCVQWAYEENPQFKSDAEKEGFGKCERVAAMMDSPNKALARVDDDMAEFQCRREFGCTLFEAK